MGTLLRSRFQRELNIRCRSLVLLRTRWMKALHCELNSSRERLCQRESVSLSNVWRDRFWPTLTVARRTENQPEGGKFHHYRARALSGEAWGPGLLFLAISGEAEVKGLGNIGI